MSRRYNQTERGGGFSDEGSDRRTYRSRRPSARRQDSGAVRDRSRHSAGCDTNTRRTNRSAMAPDVYSLSGDRPSSRRTSRRSKPDAVDLGGLSVSGRGSHAASGKRRRHGAHQGSPTIAEAVRSKSRRKVLTVGIAIVMVVAVLAAAVGVYVYFRTTDANLRLDPSNAADALVAAKADEPVYVLCAADMDNPSTKKIEDESVGYMLVRADIPNRTVTFITIPSRIQTRMSDGNMHPLLEASSLGGDSELITAVSNLAGVSISHFIYTSGSHLSGMVELLGGIDMDVTQEVDDPDAGIKVISSGQQVLDGQDALIFLRATNFPGGFEETASNRVDFTLALLGEALNSSGLSYASIVSGASSYISTDFSASDLLSLGESMRPLDTMMFYSCVLPYYETIDSESGEDIFSIYKSEWDEVKAIVEAGGDPNSIDSAADSVVPSEVTVEVRNGTQMVGAAARLGEILEQFGYQVTGVGNTNDGTVYPETLIVYTDSAYEGAAKAIVRDIGSGRVVNGGDFYSSQAGVIAIIGADYMPAI